MQADVSIRALLALDESEAASILGRVVASAPGALALRDATALIWVETPARYPEGSWLRIEGSLRGGRLRAEIVSALAAPRAPFPQMGGDWARLHADGGRRLDHLRARAGLLRALRAFFEARDFLEVETPCMVPSPGLDLHLDAFALANAPAERYLATSPEYQMKRLLSGGLPRIFQLGRCFRRGELGALHEPEFTMLEWYRLDADSERVMQDTEKLVAELADRLHGGSRIPGRGAPVDLSPPWERLPVQTAFERHACTSMAALLDDEDRFFQVFAEQIQPKLGWDRPVFLTHWPASMASLARLHPDAPELADRFEAIVQGVEICNGFGELVDPQEQRHRLERDRASRAEAALPAYPIDERFLGALEEGVPPCAGNALGVDRLVMLLLGAERIADVMALPPSAL